MKMLPPIFALLVLSGTALAQPANSFVASSSPVTRSDLRRPRFWSRSTIALVALDGAAKAADSYVTRRNLDGGGEEYNPLARPFVQTRAVQVATTSALLGAEIATAYWLHRMHHDRIGHAVLAGGAAINGFGAGSSFKNRVPDW